MHSELNKLSETKVQITITAVEEDLTPYKNKALDKLSGQVKIPGFRGGKAPISLIEKNVDPSLLQSEFLDEALSGLYSQAANNLKIRPVSRPEVNVKKFVPFTSLEFDVTTDVVGKVTLGAYKTIKLAKDKAEVTAKDVEEVMKSLQKQVATKNEVTREARTGDEVWIDFKGVDAKGEPINGADGTDYPLVLGSKTFIPGFEENIEGLKPGDEKTFTLTFPADYGVKALASKKVTFTITVKKINEIEEPAVDDAFAAKVGPFKSVKELKDDIKKQLTFEKQNELERKHQNDLVEKISDKSKVEIPGILIDQQMAYNLDEVKRNLTYRGQTYQEFLEAEALSEEQYQETILKPQAEKQVKMSLVLSEIAQAEQLFVTPEELEIRIQLLKGQYQDPTMQANLDKPEHRSDVASRMLTEKVLAKLQEYATK